MEQRNSGLTGHAHPQAEPGLEAWFRSETSWDDAVLPAYGGGSNANIVASVLDGMLGAGRHQKYGLLPPISPDLLPPELIAGARVVILLVLDGLGARMLDTALADGAAPGLGSAPHSAVLTSVFPPTTAAALTSLQTGVPPGRHGMAGYTLYLPSGGYVLNMVTWRVLNGPDESAPVPNAARFLPVPNIYNLIGRGGIDTVLVSNMAFRDSALTNVHANGVRYRGHRTLAELAARLVREVERPGKRFVFGYWDGLDALSHSYGPDSPTVRLELELIDLALRQGLLNPLAALGEDVCLLITADHGHTAIPRKRRRDLSKVRGLPNRLRHRPTGEPRVLGLSLTDPRDRDRIANRFATDAAVLDVQDALQSGLYGPAPHHPELPERIGSTLLLARSDASFSFPDYNTSSTGGHGSLTPNEMLVPLLGWRFPRNHEDKVGPPW